MARSGYHITVVVVLAMLSTNTQLGQNSLAGKQLCAEPDHESQHGKTAIPCFSEFNKTKASRRLSHGFSSELNGSR